MRSVAFMLLSLAVIASPASAVDPPLVAPGDCLYLLGAPPGAPAATTEVSGSGTKIYDVCDTDAQAEVGRDAPHRIHLWAEHDPGFFNLRGCQFEGYSEHEFQTDPGPAWITVAASGWIKGVVQSPSSAIANTCRLTLDLQLVALTDAGSVVLRSTRVFVQEPAGSLARRNVDDGWSGAVTALASDTATYRARLLLGMDIQGEYTEVDLGSPGSEFGAWYDTIQVCTIPLAPVAAPSLDTSDWERDLFEKRCLPGLWLPNAHGGELEQVMAHVLTRIDQAAGSGDSGANVSLASDRMARAASEYARDEYQRACRSTSDALRALTTP